MTQVDSAQNTSTTEKTTLEKIADNLGYFYKNGWDALFENGAAIQDAVLADIMRMGKNPNYLGSWDLDDQPNREITLTIEKIVDEVVTGTEGRKEDS